MINDILRVYIRGRGSHFVYLVYKYYLVTIIKFVLDD